MKIYIPSMGRPYNQVTLKNIPKKWRKTTCLVVPQKEYEEYSSVAEEYNVSIVCPPKNIKGIAKTRQYILDVCNERTCLMLDDDMDFCYREDMGSPKLTTIDNDNDMNKMLSIIERLLKKHPMVGISARQGNNHIDEEVRIASRMMNAYAFDVPVLRKLGIKFGRLEVMEDFDVTLQLLERGIANAVIYKYCWNQRRSGAKGGCSSYRTAEMQESAAKKLKTLHPDFVEVVEKNSKSAWNGMEVRTDVKIQWRKAYECGKSNIS